MHPQKYLAYYAVNAPLWYRQWCVLEKYIRAVVCWQLRRFDTASDEEQWRPYAADVWLDREKLETDPILESLEEIVKKERYPFTARQILDNAVQRVRYDTAMKAFKARVRYRYEYYERQGFRPGDNRTSIYVLATAEHEVAREIERECERRGFSNWYGEYRSRGLHGL